eukprot:250701_1
MEQQIEQLRHQLEAKHKSLPTAGAIRCSGISLILSQILLIISCVLLSIDYNAYTVETEEQVTRLHSILSSDQHRTEVEASCVCMWLSFPLTLIAIYGIKTLFASVFVGTYGEVLIYVAEKGYIAFITFMLLLVPALSLVSVSYDWSFYESTVGDIVPTGYWIQLYVVIFELEVIDCAVVADATFMLSYGLLAFYFVYLSNQRGTKVAKMYQAVYGEGRKIVHLLNAFCFFTLVVVFVIVLSEFAASGFFSPSSYAKWAFIWSLIVKAFIGIRLIKFSTTKIYGKLQQIFENDAGEFSNQQQVLTDTAKNYQMQQVININD